MMESVTNSTEKKTKKDKKKTKQKKPLQKANSKKGKARTVPKGHIKLTHFVSLKQLLKKVPKSTLKNCVVKNHTKKKNKKH